jgi:hypothetical protein
VSVETTARHDYATFAEYRSCDYAAVWQGLLQDHTLNAVVIL